MKTIKVIINNKEIITKQGKTILEVINDNNLDDIPTLCYDNRIEPYGSCFLCVVEVEGLNKLVPSCSSLISDGMKINTFNDRIKKARKTALELLLSNHYADCIGPCKNRCPAGVDAEGYIELISQNKIRDAIALIKKNNPLPLIIGRVCVRECELACRRNLIDQPVGINFLKRYAADLDSKSPWNPKKKPASGKKVAIIGGGPSGLTCAYYLTLKGHYVTIFEKLPELGGMLRYGIPEYRLPKNIMDKEINWILNLGVEVKRNTEFGKDITLDELRNSGYSAFYLSIGAHNARKMKISGEENTEGVYQGVDFLRNIELKNKPKLHGHVLVIGGGNTAIDAARTAIRCGSEKVTIIYRRSLKEMPAHQEEIEAAKIEGIEFKFLTNPISINNKNNKIKGVNCIKMKLVESDTGGRPKPVPIEGSEYFIKCDVLISAIGQSIDKHCLAEINNLKFQKNGSIIADEKTLETNIKGVFAGGDSVSGSLTAINAILHGSIAAESINDFLLNGHISKKKSVFVSQKDIFNCITEREFSKYPKIKREKMATIPIEERRNSFNEVELGLSNSQAKNETSRCLECGCSEYYDCILQKYATEFNINISKFIGSVRKYNIDSSHPLIKLDPNKCINCGRCVRTCSEILKVAALGFTNRGFKTIVKPALEKQLLETNCISCGNCIDNCPTGAITENFSIKISGTLERNNFETICNFCSVGCKQNYKVIDNDIFFVSNSTEEIKNTHNKGYLCVKGRFGYRYLLDKNRILKPMIKKHHESIIVNWDEAFKYTYGKIKEIINKYGNDSIAVFGSPKMSNEELYLLQKLTRVVFKTNNIHSFSNMLHNIDVSSLDDSYGCSVSTAILDDINEADVVIVLNSDLSAENLIVELKIKEAQNKGTKLVLLHSSEIKLTKFTDLWIDSIKGTNTLVIDNLSNEIIKKNKFDENYIKKHTENFEKFCENILKTDFSKIQNFTSVSPNKLKEFTSLIENPETNIVFITNVDSNKEKSKNDIKAISNFLLLTNRINRKGNGLILLRDYVNSSGLLEMGVNPFYLPGLVKVENYEEISNIESQWNIDLKNIFKPGDIKSKLIKGSIKAILIFGEDPLIDLGNTKYFNNIEFMLVSNLFDSFTSREADVVLPSSTYIEQNGTYTSCDHRVQIGKKIMEPKNTMENWEIIVNLAKGFDYQFNYKSQDDIFNEIQRVNRLYKNINYNDCWSKDLFKNGFFTSNKKANFLIYEYDFTTELPKKSCFLSCENYYNDNIKAKLSIK